MSTKRKALEYVRNTAGNAKVAHFDDDFEPIGPRLRADIMPRLVVENALGFLVLTNAGRVELASEGEPE